MQLNECETARPDYAAKRRLTDRQVRPSAYRHFDFGVNAYCGCKYRVMVLDITLKAVLRRF